LDWLAGIHFRFFAGRHALAKECPRSTVVIKAPPEPAKHGLGIFQGTDLEKFQPDRESESREIFSGPESLVSQEKVNEQADLERKFSQ
jgi:hypothetical protein